MSTATAGTRRLDEELSVAELAVVRGVATALSRREYISLNTVGHCTGEAVPHLRNIARRSTRARECSACFSSPNHPGDPSRGRPASGTS